MHIAVPIAMTAVTVFAWIVWVAPVKSTPEVALLSTMPSGLIQAIQTTPRNENDRRALAIGMIPPSAWDAYIDTLETDGNPPRQIGPNAWEVTLKNGSTWMAIGERAMKMPIMNRHSADRE